ncbi:MAG: alpha-L-fucosidase, partial [Bacillota bacterium]|nr:alpha-L-fucosidase [Bacillota bacterium]
MRKWFHQSKWRNLVDMHIPDWNTTFLGQFDPVAYADHLDVSKADCAIIYAGNCLGYCFWPTKAGHMHTGLQGRDIVSETVEACRAKGMRTIVYFNIWNRFEFDRHPDWRMRYIDGRDTTCNQDGSRNRYGICCLNNPDFRTFVRRQAEDLAGHVPCDGFWIDMIG